MEKAKLESYWNEEWKDLVLEDAQDHYRYEISNFGRIISYQLDTKNGKLLKLGQVEGYKVLRYKNKIGKLSSKYIHKLVAENFLDKPAADQTLVLHLDFNVLNNFVQNLKWGTETDRFVHWKKFRPNWFKREKIVRPTYSKLTEAQVKLLKRKIFDPNRKTRMKILARRFGISEMQLYRIKRGENWGHIKP